MKANNIPLLLIMVLFLLASCESEKSSTTSDDNSTEAHTEIQYDSAKAVEYNADEYGMRKYVMAFLYRGPNRDLDSSESAELQRAHLANIMRMSEEGTLILAGPFFDDQDLRGIYIFAVDSKEEAQKLTSTDPAIQAGSLRMELREWYGSAALMGLKDIHASLTKTAIVEHE